MRATPIDSLADPRVQEYRDLKDGEIRRRLGLFVVEGRGNLRCLIERSPYPPRSVFVNAAAFESLADLWPPIGREIPIYLAPRSVMSAVVGFDIHRGCLALGAIGESGALDELLGEASAPTGKSVVLLLEGLTDLDNVGGIFRNAMAFGVDAVLLCPRCCDPLYRKAIRTSMGATLCVPFARAQAWPESPLMRLKQLGYSIVALDPGGESLEPRGGSLPERVALLVGTEGAGLSRESLALADHALRIDMMPGVDSLNVATATGVALHHWFARTPCSRGGVS